MLISIKPQGNLGQAFLSHYNKTFKELHISSKADPHRLAFLRCSQLPFCPLGFFHKLATQGTTNVLDMAGLYYTSVGTAVHTIMQTGLARENYRLFGHWSCPVCGVKKLWTVQTNHCGTPMAYEEIEVDYRGIKGHIDTLFTLNSATEIKKLLSIKSAKLRLKWAQENLKFQIVDYKTCSMSNRDKKQKDPGQTYKEQITFYSYLLKVQWGLLAQSVLLVFIPRDNPRSPVCWGSIVTKESLTKVKRSFSVYRKAHNAVMTASSKSEVLQMLEDFGTCKGEYCEVCASGSKEKIRGQLKAAYLAAKQKNYLPLGEFLGRQLSTKDA